MAKTVKALCTAVMVRVIGALRGKGCWVFLLYFLVCGRTSLLVPGLVCSPSEWQQIWGSGTRNMWNCLSTWSWDIGVLAVAQCQWLRCTYVQTSSRIGF